MLTHSPRTDKFSFVITDDMLVKKGDGEFAQARCHLVVNVKDEHIITNSNRNSMKKSSVDRLYPELKLPL